MPLKSHPSKPPFLVFLLLSVSQTEDKAKRTTRGKQKPGGGYNIYSPKHGEGVARGQLWNGAQAIWRRETKKEGEEEYRIAAVKGASFLKGKWHTQLGRRVHLYTTLQKVEGKGRKFVSRS